MLNFEREGQLEREGMDMTTKRQKVGAMMTQHTPGPWGYDKPAESGCVSHPQYTVSVGPEDDGYIVADVFAKTAKLAQANARLIAAAPEMLAALKAVQIAEANRDNSKEYLHLYGEAMSRVNWILSRLARMEGKDND